MLLKNLFFNNRELTITGLMLAKLMNKKRDLKAKM